MKAKQIVAAAVVALVIMAGTSTAIGNGKSPTSPPPRPSTPTHDPTVDPYAERTARGAEAQQIAEAKERGSQNPVGPLQASPEEKADRAQGGGPHNNRP